MQYYAVRVRPQKEFLAEQLLRSQGHNIYLPLENARRRLSKRDRRLYGWVNVPLLPGYIFAGVRAPEDLAKLFIWSFVLSVVGDPATQTPHPISGLEMAHIRAVSQERTKRQANPIDWAPSRGEFYRIVQGPWSTVGLTVRCEALIGRKAKEFWADMNGRLVRLKSAQVVAA